MFLVARLTSGDFVTGLMSNSAFFVQRYDAQSAKAGGEHLYAKLPTIYLLFYSRGDMTKIRPAQPV